MNSEVQNRAAFSKIRYAQVWEDADVLLEALRIQPGDVCVSIASAGDNALAMLAQGPKKLVAIDLSPAQLACLEFRVAAYRSLQHRELLQLIGSRPGSGSERTKLYQKCRSELTPKVQEFWDGNIALIERGIGDAGKFERYFGFFRNIALPLVHSRRRIRELLAGGSLERRQEYYQKKWNTWSWRMLFQFFFSRAVMGRMGRDPSFFKYVEGSVADRIMMRTRHALVELDPAENPYLHWILTGSHGAALPYALREENFDPIRRNLDRLEWRCQPLEAYLQEVGPCAIDAYNLSDIFEYMSGENYEQLLQQLCNAARPGARLAYWNMLAPRSRPERMASQLKSFPERSRELLARDKAFFYSAFVLEEVQSS